MHKKCRKLPATHAMWKTECIHLRFLPTPYRIAPIVYAIPPPKTSANPVHVSSFGNRLPFTIMHQPITK